jgi:sec-independent protein translocase protein TatA
VWHLLIVLGAFMLLFGAKKMPEAARSVAQSLRIFKQEMKEPPEPPGAEAPLEPTLPTVPDDQQITPPST